VVGPLVSFPFFTPLLLPHYLIPRPVFGMIDPTLTITAWIFLIWMFSIAHESNRRLGPGERKSIVPMATVCLYVAVFTPFSFYLLVNDSPRLLGMAAMLYTFYFTARQFDTVKKRERSSLREYILVVFMLWFFPLGVWFLQPQVRKYLGTDALPTDPASPPQPQP